MTTARIRYRPFVVAICALLVQLMGAPEAGAAAGDLDLSFDADGKVTTDFASSNDFAGPVVVQLDGKIVAGGIGGDDFGLARYNTDGSLDPSFSGNGKVLTDFTGLGTGFFASFDQVNGLALQPDGKTVAAGCANCRPATLGGGDFALARYNPDGSIDTTFGAGGRLITDFAGDSDAARGVVVQPDGKIVAAGEAITATFHDFALARDNADGTLDSSFGTGGMVTTDFAGSSDGAAAVVRQPDGKIVAAGFATFGPSPAVFALVRYNTDGSLDLTFGSGGKVTTDFGGSTESLSSLALQGDGKLVAAGSHDTGTPGNVSDIALARYNSDGTLDGSFGTAGMVITDFAGSNDQGGGVALQSDGKIVVAAVDTSVFDVLDFGVVRYESNGALDATFGTGGRVTTDFAGGTDFDGGVAVQADGKIVAAGGAEIGSTFDFALARYQADGGGGGGCTITGTPNDDVLSGTSGDDHICGLGGNDQLSGLGGDDLLEGGDGNDTLIGGTGDDSFDGNAGTDTVSFAGAAGAVTANLTTGTVSAGTNGNDTIVLGSVENLVGGNGNDTLTGDGVANRLTGGPGGDRLLGKDANDTLLPGAGGDTNVSGGTGTDTVSYADISSGGKVTINLATGSVTGGAGTDTLSAIENATGTPQTASTAGDSITGSSGNNTLKGLEGNDTLNGGAGTDTCDGGPGTDIATNCESTPSVP
jgi:uncharacterized delta-60 repeat protein